MQSGVKTLSAGGGASLCCLLLLWLIYSHLLREVLKHGKELICDGTPVIQAPTKYIGTCLSKKREEGGRMGQLAVGTCEIVMLNRDSSVPRRTIARQTARCACRRGQIAGTTRARPACVDARIVRSRQWCEMAPCLEGEVCSLLFNRSGWTCTRGSGRIKTVTAPLTVQHAYNASELPMLQC
ncbi:Protein FAM19A5 [Collichthys lucidus]|uniref:Protein FAM19A5 n=1 Tax=Collichthys lucidus TaxID=240159 RepID=A0A4U5UQ17_COLLU|nr:Protein FAM19A5 [Collichthys lucidus]